MLKILDPIDFPLSIDFPRAYPSLSLWAIFRELPDDFYVEERLGFPLTGAGEHQCLWVEKTSHNTHWVLSALAEYAGVSEVDIGYCGRKDRHAVTRQWFSRYCPPVGKDRENVIITPVDWSLFTMEGVKILSVDTHHKKLRLGDHEANHFNITLKDVHRQDLSLVPGSLSEEEKYYVANEIVNRLQQGVPNYFGAQRFGRDANNLTMAHQWLVNGVSPPRKQRSMILSAARSYVFNTLLAYRVHHQQWNRSIEGDVLVNAVPVVSGLVKKPPFPTGPLWGRGRSPAQSEALIIEKTALAPLASWCERLEYLGLNQERRSLVLVPNDVSAHWQADNLCLSFSLPSGTFATAVLAEITQLMQAH
ncbi:MAG: tRNA pseudouridine13 synthase [Candidatus Endobugula sp.]